MRKGILVIMFLACVSFVSAQFRVIGYVHLRGDAPDLSRIAFDKLTHINVAFSNPDSTGALKVPPGLDDVVKVAHESGVKVLISIGGGSHNPYYASLLMDNNRPGFIQRLIDYTTAHALDGIDIDLEGDAIDSNYEKLIADLSTALKPSGRLLTAAVATWNGNTITDAALKKFDFINIMSYDQTGPWRPTQPGPHSTFEKAEEDLAYWTVTRGLSAKTVNLGLPFYGYCFGTTLGESLSYEEIIKKFPGSDKVDVVQPKDGGAVYYNGRPTIKRKTELALKKTGGVMIWQLFQDAKGRKSLLRTIHTVIKKGTPLP